MEKADACVNFACDTPKKSGRRGEGGGGKNELNFADVYLWMAPQALIVHVQM